MVDIYWMNVHIWHTMPRVYMSMSFGPSNILYSRYYYYPHFPDGGTEA